MIIVNKEIHKIIEIISNIFQSILNIIRFVEEYKKKKIENSIYTYNKISIFNTIVVIKEM